ncbi:hypothetical protein ACFT5B_17700 [Luteimicrobium sp. NPDC057192]|uniref:hypothetical protein n=1 Tax=Luteimicrobium sp. NPDC057192 TaxID=3346042 RepID=UPI0036364D5F
MSGTVSTPEPARPQQPAPGNMRPVHDGADPVDETRRRLQDRLSTVLSWLTLAICLAVGIPIDNLRPGWVWWVVSGLIALVIVLVLQFVVRPRVVRRLTPWLLARQNRRNAL